MLTIQYCSDLHLEFPENEKYIRENPISIKCDTLILAGDIMLFKDSFEKHWFLDYVSDNFRQVFWIPGNHEYYAGADLAIEGFYLNEKIRTNVHLVNNRVVSYKGTDLIFSTLWSHIADENAAITAKSVNDFNLILYNGKRLTVQKYNELHQHSIEFIGAAIRKSEAEEKIIISHHVPSLKLMNPIYNNSNINGAFVTSLEDLIKKWSPDCWIFGHSHYNCGEIQIGKTKMMTNQLGYVQSNEHAGYRNIAIN